MLAQPSAGLDTLSTTLIRGACEYRGQKCSAASRAYLPASLWSRLKDELVSQVDALPMGDVTDFTNFVGAVIDRRSFDRLAAVLDRAKNDPKLEIAAGGTADDSEGYFIRPTVLVSSDPKHEVFSTEYFGPILSIYVYDDSADPEAAFDEILDVVDTAAPYALTGSIMSTDRLAIAKAQQRLRFTAGNFYVNDKPTGAVVGQQPFGGSRASGTNDKAGSILNLQRWVSPRAIKESFVAPTSVEYPAQAPEPAGE